MKTYQDFINWLETIDDTTTIEYLSPPTSGKNKGKTNFTVSRSFNDENELDGIIVRETVLNPRKLPLKVFELVITLLTNNRLEYSAYKGKTIKREGKKSIGIPLGNPELELDTVEGIVAHKYYHTPIGNTVYRRASTISNILVAAGICTHIYGEGILKLVKRN